MIKSSIFPQNRVLESLLRELEPEKAIPFLKICPRNDKGMFFFPSSFTFSWLIYRFCLAGCMERAMEVLELMNSGNVKYPYGNFVCSCVVSGFCRIGKPELGVEFFENAVSLGGFRPNMVTYSVLVTALCLIGRLDEVESVFHRMENEGLGIDVVFYSSWFCGYFREGNLLEALRKHRQMVDEGVGPDVISYTILVDGFSKEGHAEKAVGILNKMVRDGFRPNLITYTAVILGFCKQGKMDQAFSVFQKVEELGIVADEFIYATLIDGVCRKGDLDRAFSLLEEMEEKGIKPSVVTYNTVINGLCKVGRTSEADEFSKEIVGDVVTYSTLLYGYIEDDNVQGIMGTRERLEESGIHMDVTMCNILIKAHFMVGAPQDARALYREMSKFNLVANSSTYWIMINGYLKADRVEDALEVFDDLRRTSISSVECYHCIIRGLCKTGMVDVATEVFVELVEKEFGLDSGIYKILIDSIFTIEGAIGVLALVQRVESLRPEVYEMLGNYLICCLCKRDCYEAASDVYVSMKRRGSVLSIDSHCSILKGIGAGSRKWLVEPSLSMFIKEYGMVEPLVIKTVVHYFCSKDVAKALLFFKKMKEVHSTITFPVIIIKELIKEDRVLDVYKLVIEAGDNLPSMDVVDYTIIVDALCKEGYVDKALDICAFARNKGTTLNIITFNTVIYSLCSQGCLFEAFRLFDSLDRIHLLPSVVTYTTLIDNLCKQGYLEDAKILLDKMLHRGLKPNTRIYNSFIDAYCKFGQLDEAYKFLEDLDKEGLKHDSFTISSVINGLYKKGDMEGALSFFSEFKRKGILPDFLGYLHLINGLYTKGRMEESRSVLREMLLSESVLKMMNKIDTGIESESVVNILDLLCAEGRVKEAVAIINEIRSVFFPIRMASHGH